MKRSPFLWIATVAVVLMFAAALSVPSQTVNQGRTYVASQNVRYANEAGTGTTVNKLAKLTGAPSTAIIAATTDTSGIVGIVVSGAGTTGSANIAFAGKASCDFDSATTAGHYVTIDTSTAGDCMDTGAATYPTSGQVIGIVTSTNGGAGTYEVDLTLRQPQAGGGGGGTLGYGAFASLPGTCAAGDHYLSTDSIYDSWCTSVNTWKFFFNGLNLTPPTLAVYSTWVNQGTATAVETYGGIYMTFPATSGASIRGVFRAVPAAPYRFTIVLIPTFIPANYADVGIFLRDSVSGSLISHCISWTNLDGGWIFKDGKYTSPTVYNGPYSTMSALQSNGRPVFLSVYDDNTNRFLQWSNDGKNWITVSTSTRTNFITPDQIGLGGSFEYNQISYAWFIHAE